MRQRGPFSLRRVFLPCQERITPSPPKNKISCKKNQLLIQSLRLTWNVVKTKEERLTLCTMELFGIRITWCTNVPQKLTLLKF